MDSRQNMARILQLYSVCCIVNSKTQVLLVM